jgi:hypothetical protein
MPVVIVGSGRCGTSMVTRLLNLCGLHIGRSFDMYDSANSCNPTGYWEHRAFRNINSRILSHFGGSELLPPIFPDNWQYDESLDLIVGQAQEAIRNLSRLGPFWGWKDPRTSLTLPFWQRLLPDLKVIVCVRNPLEVIRSFEDLLKGYGSIGGHFGVNQGYLNWYTYNASVITNTDVQNRVLTCYEDYFPDFHDQLNHLLGFIGLDLVEPHSVLDRRLSALHDPNLKHHHKTLDDVIDDKSLPREVKGLYLAMLKSIADPLESDAELRAASATTTVQEITIDQTDPARLQKIVHDLIQMEARNRELEDILSSRTHRVASQICALLIGKSQFTNRVTSYIADTVNGIVATVDTHQKVHPVRWY